MWRAALALILAMAANQLTAGGLELCVENSARLDRWTLEVFRTELGAILDASGRPARFKPCQPGLVKLTLRQEPPEDEPTALGGTRLQNGRLTPEIELFVAPTAQIIGTRLPGLLGLALARVATHELGHWLGRGAAHSARGVMMERLSAAHLMAPDRGFFRLPPGE